MVVECSIGEYCNNVTIFSISYIFLYLIQKECSRRFCQWSSGTNFFVYNFNGLKMVLLCYSIRPPRRSKLRTISFHFVVILSVASSPHINLNSASTYITDRYISIAINIIIIGRIFGKHYAWQISDQPFNKV